MAILTHRRRLIGSFAAVIAHAGLAPNGSAGKKARKRKNRNRCTVGPCNYDQCLLRLDSMFPGDTGWSRAVKQAYAARCCAPLALTKTGKKYRVAVLQCFAAQVSR